MDIANQLGMKDETMSAMRQLSLIAIRKTDFNSAFSLAEMAMKIAETIRNPAALAGAHDQLGNVLFSKNDLRGAEQEYLAASKYEEQVNHRSDLAFTLAKLARVYEGMGAASQTESALRRAAQLFRELGMESEEAQVAANLNRISMDYPQPDLNP